MRRGMALAVVAGIVLALGTQAQAQRRTQTGPKAAGAPAKIIYKQNFDEDGIVDNFQGTVAWTDDPAGAFGSKGSMKITPGPEGGNAERYIKWINDDTTIIFMFYAHGAKAGYFQGWAEKAGKNLHAEFPFEVQDTWQMVKIKADSLVGFGGGASSPGEAFRNIMFHCAEFDKAVENPYMLVDSVVVFSGPEGTPPKAPAKNVTAKWYAQGNAVSINWEQAQDDVGVYQYDVHRAETPGVEPSKDTRVATVTDTYYEDKTTAAGKTYYYKIVAKNPGGYTAASDEVKYEAQQAGGGAAAPAKPAAKAEF